MRLIVNTGTWHLIASHSVVPNTLDGTNNATFNG